MARGAWILRRASAIGLAMAVAACDDIADPTTATVALEILPSVQGSAGQFAGVTDDLRILIEMESAGTFLIVADTTVAIDPVTGEAMADVEVPLVQDPQNYVVTLQALLTDGTVLFAGTDTVTIARAEADSPTEVVVPISYVGPPTARLVISPRDTVVLPGATFDLTATAIDDDGNPTTPAPLVSFSLLNPADSIFATIDQSGSVAVASTAITAEVIVMAMTPDSVIDHALIQIGDFPSVRRTWIVDPANALPWPTQFGTNNFPFETIQRGLDRAQIRDTVFVAVSTYLETITGVRPVTLLGDSTISGVPTVSSPTRNSITSPTGPVEIKRMRFQGTNAGLDISATALDITSLQFQNISGQALLITQSGFTTIDGITISGITGGDTGRGIQMFAGASLTVRNANITGTDDAGIRVDSVGVVNIAQSSIQQTSLADEQVYGIELVFVDSALIDTTNIRSTNGGGIATGGLRTLVARNDTLSNTFVNAVEPDGLTGRVAMFIQDVATARVVDAAFLDNIAGGILVIDSAVNATTSIENSSFDGLYWGVWASAFPGTGSVSNFSVINSTFRGERGQTRETAGIIAQGMQTASVTGSRLDSITGWGIFAGDNATVTVDNNVITDIDDVGGSAFIFPTIHVVNIASSGSFTNNQLLRNGAPAFLFTGTAPDVTVTTNVIDSNDVGIRLDSAVTVGVDVINANNNLITNSINQGILTLEMGGNFQGNDIVGNSFGVDNQTQNQITLDATNSWWGDVLGPSCGVGATDCDAQSPGDPVSVNVTASPFATAPVTTGLPAPPVSAARRFDAASLVVRLEESRQAVAARVQSAPRLPLRGYLRR